MTHGFMGLVAAMHCALSDWDDMTTIDFHRYEAVKFINKRLTLEGRDNAMVSDCVIVAVALLVHVEAFIGSVPAARAHLMGLTQMVQLRGGINDGFGHSPLLQRALAWADFAHATASQSPLSFPLTPVSTSVLGIQNRFLLRSMMLTAMATNRHDNGLTIHNREVLELFELLHSATQAVGTFAFDKLESLRTERSQISDTVYVVEYRLCNLEEMIRLRARNMLPISPEMADAPGAAGYNSPTDLSNALVYASHLYLHMVLRAQPPQAKGHRLLVEALMGSLSEVVIGNDLLTGTWSQAGLRGMGDEYIATMDGTPMDGWRNGNREYYESSSDGTPDSSKDETKDDLHEDILLWILFVGSCAQVPPSYSWDGFETTVDCRGFFLSSLRKHCLARGILSQEVLTSKLRDLVWLDSWCEKQLEMIWKSIGMGLGI
jgi:hypothetical protein